LIDDLDDDVRSYLAAVGALAVYVAVQDATPVRIGFCRDPRKALAYISRGWPRAAFAWMAWFADSKNGATHFVAEVSAHEREIIVNWRSDLVRIPRELPFVIAHVETIAARLMVTLTPHATAIERAKVCADRLDVALNALQRAGHFASFNHAYRIYREEKRLAGESAAPYWAAKEQMRQTIIRWLITHATLDQNALIEEIRARFPWFKQYGGFHRANAIRSRN
jgi:virulence-associated protein VagC